MDNILEVKDLSFGYVKDLLLFQKLSFSLKKGEIKAIVGESGAFESGCRKFEQTRRDTVLLEFQNYLKI